MALNVKLAIRFTPYYAKTVGWKDDFAKICALLGFQTYYPQARDFVVALSNWQSKNQLDPDGLLGPLTWKKMKPGVNNYSGQTPGFGPHPKWVYAIDSTANISALPSRPDLSPSPSQASAEDRVIKEFAKVAVQARENPLVPVAVSPQYLASFAYPHGQKTLSTTGAISQLLQVGQEWKGLEGARLIVGLQGGGGLNYAGIVLFVTESGQGYEQRLPGWESDLQARVWSDVAESLKPIQKMLDVELAFLNGAQAAWSFPLYLAVHGGAFFLEHRKQIPLYVEIGMALIGTVLVLRDKAPNLFNKVILAILKRIWGSLLDNLLRVDNITAESVANFLGGLIISRGKNFFSKLAEETASALRTCWQMLKTCVQKIGPYVSLLAKGIPDAAKTALNQEEQTVKETIETLRKLGAVVSEMDLKNIVAEFKDNEQVIMDLILKLDENVEKL